MSVTGHLLRFVFAFFLFWPSISHAIDIAPGIATVEEGDDRFRPSILLHVARDQIFSRFHYYGRKFGVVRESIYLLSFNRELDVFRMWGWDLVKGAFGVSLINQHTAIKFADHPDESKSEDQLNVGFNVGAYFNVPIPEEVPMFAKIGWESHIFLAGSAGILLANGRKQVISLCAGLSL